LKRLTSFLVCAACIAAAQLSSPVSATGLYDDVAAFFSSRDTSRALIVLRQTELHLVAGNASVLAAEFDFGFKRRYELRAAIPFDAVRRSGDIVTGMGDVVLFGRARLFGDSLSTRGFFLRIDARLPSASADFPPFSADSADVAYGFELRARLPLLALRAAALYSFSADRRIGHVLVDDSHFIFAASGETPIAPGTRAGVSVFYLSYDEGSSRGVALATLRHRLSASMVLSIDGAVEALTARSRVFDGGVSVALLYAFPPASRVPGAPGEHPEVPPEGMRPYKPSSGTP
jgi:hypothetical protein